MTDLQITAPFFRVLKQQYCTVPERTRQNYYSLWQKYKQQDAASILLEPYITFSGGGYGSGGFGNLRGATRLGYERKLRQAHSLLNSRDVKITQLDWDEMGLNKLTEQDFVYFDPPYIAADVRSYSKKTINYERLVQVLENARFRWVLSEYESPLYLERLGEPLGKKSSQLSVSNLSGVTRSPRVECIWSNLKVRAWDTAKKEMVEGKLNCPFGICTSWHGAQKKCDRDK